MLCPWERIVCIGGVVVAQRVSDLVGAQCYTKWLSYLENIQEWTTSHTAHSTHYKAFTTLIQFEEDPLKMLRPWERIVRIGIVERAQIGGSDLVGAQLLPVFGGLEHEG